MHRDIGHRVPVAFTFRIVAKYGVRDGEYAQVIVGNEEDGASESLAGVVGQIHVVQLESEQIAIHVDRATASPARA